MELSILFAMLFTAEYHRREQQQETETRVLFDVYSTFIPSSESEWKRLRNKRFKASQCGAEMATMSTEERPRERTRWFFFEMK